MTLRRKSVSRAGYHIFVSVLHILAIMGIALDRSKWRPVISPKIAIILSLTPFGREKY